MLKLLIVVVLSLSAVLIRTVQSSFPPEALRQSYREPAIQTRGVQSQDRIDGMQDQLIAQAQRGVDDNTRRIDMLAEAIADLTAAMNRFTGIGVGIGLVLTALQIGQIIRSERGHRIDHR